MVAEDFDSALRALQQLPAPYDVSGAADAAFTVLIIGRGRPTR
jgi:hypothetical protein